MATIFKKTRIRYLVGRKRITAAEAERLRDQGRPVERKVERSRLWYIRYTLPDGRVRQVAGFTDKTATQAKAVELEKNAAREAAGLVAPTDRHLLGPVGDHLADYVADIEARGRTADYVAKTRSRILALLQAARITRLAELEPARVQAALADLRKAGRSIETRNHYLVAIKGFTRWLWKTGRLPADPLTGLSRQNADVDRRVVRRALGAEELARLVAAAEKTPKVFRGLAGPDRAALYVLAAGSGLRARELAHLTQDHLALDADPPRVLVDAAYAKNRRQDVLPLPAQVAEYLRGWLATRAPQPPACGGPGGLRPVDPAKTPLWPGRWFVQAAAMLRADLATAGIPYQDASGRVADFHSLRATFATLLARRGCNLQTAQALLRHSDPKLTARTYTKLGTTDLGAAVADLTVVATTERLGCTKGCT